MHIKIQYLFPSYCGLRAGLFEASICAPALELSIIEFAKTPVASDVNACLRNYIFCCQGDSDLDEDIQYPKRLKSIHEDKKRADRLMQFSRSTQAVQLATGERSNLGAVSDADEEVLP